MKTDLLRGVRERMRTGIIDKVVSSEQRISELERANTTGSVQVERQIIASGGAAGSGTVSLAYASTSEIADVAAAETAGTSSLAARGDHAHYHGVFATGDYHTDYLLANGSRVLTAKWDQSGAFDILQRGGNIVVANSKDLLLYSDNSATPSLATGGWDAGTGKMALGSAVDANKALMVVSALYEPTDTAYVILAQSIITESAVNSRSHYGVYSVPVFDLNGNSITQGGTQAAGLFGWYLDGQAFTSPVFSTAHAIQTAGAVTGGATVTTYTHLKVTNFSIIDGAVGTQYGIDIPALSGATTNIGIRNVSTTRLTAAVTVGADAAATSGLILDITGNAGIKNAGELRLYELTANGTNYTAFKAAATMAGDVTYTLPAADGTSGYFLRTNGTGTLSWASAGAGGAHDHTTADGSGVLTNDEHDGYMNVSAIATPSNPSVGAVRVFTRTNGNTIEVVARSATGDECIICTLINVAHTNTLALNWTQ